MIKFKYSGSIQKINDAIIEAQKILTDENFYSLIKQKPSFDFSNAGNSTQISDAIKSCPLILHIKTYKSIGPSLGKEYPNDPTSIYINISWLRFHGRTIPSIVNTLIHEAVHAADSDNEDLEFNHGDDNKSIGKGNSAPYWIGCLSEILLENPGKVISVLEVDIQSQKDCG